MARCWMLPLLCLAGTGLYVVRTDQEETRDGVGRERRATNTRDGIPVMEVVGGIIPPPLKFPWMALVQLSGRSICGGSLISIRHVLSAEHCFAHGRPPSQYRVILGEYRQESPDRTEQIRSVSSIIKHRSVDAAILVLSSYATLNYAVRMVRVARYIPELGTPMTASGWGLTVGADIYSDSNYLQYVTVPLVDAAKCIEKGMRLGSHELCVGRPTGPFGDTCSGDSGGPLVYPAYPHSNPLQVGIVSWGIRWCPAAARYSVYASVPFIYSWIVYTLGCDWQGTWTPLLDGDTPDGDGDYETKSLHKDPCKGNDPICLNYKIVSTSHCVTPHQDCKYKEYQKLKYSRKHGLSCVNKNQGTVTKGWWFVQKKYKCRCCDYAVKFKCPSLGSA